MSNNQYPVFDGGQTLTNADLNDLRDFLHERDRLVGRMIGFGVNCGLGGVVSSGTTLTIKPGLAVDQYGEPLVLPAERTIALPPTAVTPSYDFIATGPGGFSVVLEATDTIEPTPDCGQANCAGHAELHTRGVAARVVAGRVTGTRMDFSGEPLLTVEPIRLALDSTPINSYPTLRNAIATRLTNGTQPLVHPALIAKLQATSIASADTAGIKGYKSGWLNMVLFATLDLVRVEALLRLGCDRSTTRPGVVLGWVHQVSSAWVFDCAYRHAWEPPRGFTEAYLGGTCTDPAGLYRDELEALLAGYAPPDPVPAGPTPTPTQCPKGSTLIGGKCVFVYYPPPKIPDKWYTHWQLELDPKVPIWNPPIDQVWKDPWKIYQTDQWNRFDDGVIGANDYIGRPGAEVKNVLGGFIADGGGLADIRVLAPKDAQALDGYLPSGGFSPSDTIVLSVDTAGTVTATGRVPAVRNTRLVGAALPAALGAATAAQQAATELKAMSAGFDARLTKTDQTTIAIGTDLTNLAGEFTSYRTKLDVASFGTRIDNVELKLKEVGTAPGRIDVIDGKLDILQKLAVADRKLQPRIQGVGDLDTPVGPGGVGGLGAGGGVGGIGKALGQGIAEFAETVVAAMRSLPDPPNRNFRRYTAAAEASRARLAGAVAPNAPDDAPTLAATAVDLLAALRTAVKASGVSAEFGRQLDAKLRELGGLLP